jgi:hypothetical protein
MLLYKIPGAARTLAPWSFQPAVDHLLNIQTAYVDTDGCLALGEVEPRLINDTDKSVYSTLRHAGRAIDIYELQTLHRLLEKCRLGGRPELSTLQLQKSLDNLLSVKAIHVGRGEEDTVTRYENVKGARVDTRPYDVLSRHILTKAWEAHHAAFPAPKALEYEEAPEAVEEVTASLEDEALSRFENLSDDQRARVAAQTTRAKAIADSQLPLSVTTEALCGVVLEIMKIVKNPLHLTQLADALGHSNTKLAGEVIKCLRGEDLVRREIIGKKTFWNLSGK